MQFKELRKLVDGLEARPTLLFPEDVAQLIESGDASEQDVTSFEIQAVIRGLKDHRIWKQRDGHYDSVCWRMEARESQCQWFSDGDYLMYTERTPSSAHECGWSRDHIVTFSHPPKGRTMADTVALEEGIVPVRVTPAVEAQNVHVGDTGEIRQYMLRLDSDGTLGNAIQRITHLVTWWLLEHFRISSRRTSLSYNFRFMEIINNMVADSFVRRSP